MSTVSDYGNYDALGLGELISAGALSAGEVLEAALRRSEAVNGELNAIVTSCPEEARARTNGNPCSGPLAGVPMLIKDLTAMRGLHCTMGSRLFKDYVPDHDAEIVRRYRNAGLVLFGKTNTPEFGLTVTTESSLLGACRNPWDREYTTGGSSGGAAAAVAAGIVPAAHATDGGGSIRIPASCCGLVGLKPTRARNPAGPDVGEGWGGMATGHVISRSVRDTAAFLDLSHGPASGDPYHAPHFSGSFLDASRQPPGTLRIALNLTPITDGDVDPECIKAVQAAAALCESLGHVVEQAQPRFDPQEFLQATSAVISANVANQVQQRLLTLQRPLRADDIEETTRSILGVAALVNGAAYAGATQVIQRISRSIAAFHRDYDVMLTPTLMSPPVPLGWLNTQDADQDRYGERFKSFWGYTNLQNATGQPAISLPLHWSDSNLPVGVQFVGRFGDEATLLQLATQLEQARPWFDRRPERTPTVGDAQGCARSIT